MANPSHHVTAHLEWIGFVRPIGLVVSAPALVKAGVILNRRDIAGQNLLRECVENGTYSIGTTTDNREPVLPDFRQFAERVLGWSFSPKGYAGIPNAPIPPDLELPLPESGDVFKPDFAVRSEPVRASRRPCLSDGRRASGSVFALAASGRHPPARRGSRSRNSERWGSGTITSRPDGTPAAPHRCTCRSALQW